MYWLICLIYSIYASSEYQQKRLCSCLKDHSRFFWFVPLKVPKRKFIKTSVLHSADIKHTKWTNDVYWVRINFFIIIISRMSIFPSSQRSPACPLVSVVPGTARSHFCMKYQTDSVSNFSCKPLWYINPEITINNIILRIGQTKIKHIYSDALTQVACSSDSDITITKQPFL